MPECSIIPVSIGCFSVDFIFLCHSRQHFGVLLEIRLLQVYLFSACAQTVNLLLTVRVKTPYKRLKPPVGKNIMHPEMSNS